MKLDLRNNSSKQLNYSTKRSESQKSFIVDPHESQTNNEVWYFFTNLSQLYEYWKIRHNMQIELNYTLD